MISDIDYSNDELRQICIESPTFYEIVKAAIMECEKHGCSKLWLGSLTQDMQDHTQIQLVVTREPSQQIDEN